MEIVKGKSGQLGIKVYRNNKYEVYSLRKIAIVGISALTLGAALTHATYTKFQFDQIEKIREIADEFGNMKENTIEIGGQTVSIQEEINEFADAKEALLKARGNLDFDAIKDYEIKYTEEAENIHQIGKAIIEDNVAEHFDIDKYQMVDIKTEELADKPQYVAQIMDNRNDQVVEQSVVEGAYTNTVLTNDERPEKVIKGMKDAITTGEGIEVAKEAGRIR